MQGFVRDIVYPLDHALAVTLLKTGIHIGELCNLDLRDVSLSTETSLDDISTHTALDGRGLLIYAAADPSAGSVMNSEERTASNKRKRSAVVLVDDELKAVPLC